MQLILGKAFLFGRSHRLVSGATGDQQPSHVLLALGLDDEMADSAVRFSIGRFTTEQEIDYTIEAVSNAVARLRRR